MKELIAELEHRNSIRGILAINTYWGTIRKLADNRYEIKVKHSNLLPA